MFRNRYIKEIKGTVFTDLNNNGVRDDSEPGLKDIGINLYQVAELDAKKISGSTEGITVLRKNPIFSTKTNKLGEYKFYVWEGNYSIALDMDTLPEGKEAIKPEFSIDEGLKVVNDFAVTATASNKLERSASKQDILSQGLPEMSSLNRINLAFENGKIDQKTKISLYLQSMFEKSRLDNEYRSKMPAKSGTTAVKEIHDYIRSSRADNNILERAKRSFADSIPSLDKVYTSPSGFFKIHYAVSGSNAVPVYDSNYNGVPDYIREMASSFDHVKEVTCGTRGFRTPILDGDASAFDVYVYDLNGIYGVTFPVNYYTGKGSNKKVASCSIGIDNSYAPSKGFDKSRNDCMKVTAAHEFFHAVQYAYNVDSDSWWKEASATWNEDEIYSGVNDYVRYLKSVFSSPEKTLEKSSYGGVLFAKCLSEHWGGYETIKRIWEMQAETDSSINAIDRAIREKYSSENIYSVFNKYTAYNFNPTQYYKEGSQWKESIAIKNRYSTYPVTQQTGQLSHLAASYQLFKPNGTETGKSLKISIDGTARVKWGFKLQRRKRNDKLCDMTEIASDGFLNKAEIISKDFGDTYDEICLIPANLEKERDGAVYRYSASLE